MVLNVYADFLGNLRRFCGFLKKIDDVSKLFGARLFLYIFVLYIVRVNIFWFRRGSCTTYNAVYTTYIVRIVKF